MKWEHWKVIRWGHEGGTQVTELVPQHYRQWSLLFLLPLWLPLSWHTHTHSHWSRDHSARQGLSKNRGLRMTSAYLLACPFCAWRFKDKSPGKTPSHQGLIKLWPLESPQNYVSVGWEIGRLLTSPSCWMRIAQRPLSLGCFWASTRRTPRNLKKVLSHKGVEILEVGHGSA